MWRMRKRTVKMLMARACPSHAKVIPCVFGFGPPCVAVHTPCPVGHYDCVASNARLLQLGAQERLHAQVKTLERKLDDALEEVARLIPSTGGPGAGSTT